VGGSASDPEWSIGHPILFPNILRVNWTFQIRVPIDDTHTWHVMYQAYPQPPGAEGKPQDHIPVYDIPIKDERGRFITDFVLGQDMMAWVTQGPTRVIAVRRHALPAIGRTRSASAFLWPDPG